MPNFCTKCGSPLSGGPFCVKCGADARSLVPSMQPQSPSSAAQPPSPASAGTVPTSAKQGMSTLAKLAIVAVAVVFVGGVALAGGLYYVVHRVSQKVHQVEATFSGSDSNSTGNNPDPLPRSDGAMINNVCRLLAKQEVSRAIGVEIIRTEPADNGCSYIAEGDEADMLAKHATAMTASRGADQKTQQMLQTFAGGMFKEFQSQRPQPEQDKSGEVLVLNFSVDQHAAEEQMRLNAKALSILGDMQGLPGIGDQAFVSSDGVIMVRKGKNLIRIMFVTCPCGVEAVKPLAKKISDAL